MSDSDESNPYATEQNAARDSQGPSLQSGSRDAYVPYQQAPAVPKKNFSFWIAAALILAAVPLAQHFLHARAPSPASVTAIDPKLDLLKDFNQYVEVAEKPTTAQAPGTDSLLTPQAKDSEAKVMASAKLFATNDPNFVSLVGKCFIDGHDIHFVLPDGKVLSHVPVGFSLPPLLARAREVILGNPRADTRVFVFKDKIQILDSGGKLLVEEPVK